MKQTKVYKISNDLNTVRSVFLDLEEFGKRHPLIIKVKSINTENRRYSIYEKPFRCLPFKINYEASIIVYDDFSFAYQIIGIPLKKAKLDYMFVEEAPNCVKIELTIELVGNAIVRKILMNKMMDAQDTIMSSF